MKHIYYRSCVDFDSSNYEQINWLRHVIDSAREITLTTFRSQVANACLTRIKMQLGYAIRGGRHTNGISLARDWHVRYYKSRTPDGHPCVFLKWSAIEFIFLSEAPTF